MLHLFDTATAQVAPLEPRDPGKLSIYLCGPTVSGEPHVGHGRTTLTWDILRRYLTWSGVDVTLVSNVTDIEDKIIAQANRSGRTTEAVVATYESLWWQTMDRLGVERPDLDPHATAWVPQMIELIDRLVTTGHAYVGGDGVYFASESVPDYGLLARQPVESLRAGARLALDEEAGKRSPMDFVLWKAAKPGEPWWQSPWGRGRPGWHTECVVMSLGLLGDGFDLHGGGFDLAFPHHENERAQAVAAGRTFARRWAHSGMVVSEGGEKMSKSVGNTLSLPELLVAHDPRALRLLVLQSHYRSPMALTESAVVQAEDTLRGLDTFASRFGFARDGALETAAVAAFAERMEDDLDTPRALAQLFELRREANVASGERATKLAATLFHLFEVPLGLPLGAVRGGRGSAGAGSEPTAEVNALVEERNAARAARDWARSDAIRDTLAAAGWIVEDGPGGTTVRR